MTNVMSLRTLIAPACDALELDPLEHGLQLLDAAALAPPVLTAPPAARPTTDGAWSEIQGVGPYTPPLLPFPLVPTRPALVCRLPEDSSSVQRMLLSRYPAGHAVTLVRVTAEAVHRWSITLGELDQQPVGSTTCAYLAPLDPLDDLRGPEGPTAVVARLLGPNGCPWDREQTHQSLRKDLLAETHEVLEALDTGDTDGLAEELGDLLLQILLHSEMGRQAGEFDLGSVYEHVAAKLIRRHPHIFGSASVSGSDDVLRNWDTIKQAERADKGKAPRGTLEGIPPTLPALMLAQETLRKASKAGFDSGDIGWDWDKLGEELTELKEAARTSAVDEVGQRRVAEEFGDLLLALVQLARRLDLDAEEALREAVAKFRRRFARLEQTLREHGRDLRALAIEEKEAVWSQTKQTD